MPNDKELESWRANGRVVINRYGRHGETVKTLVNRGRTIQLTEAERLLNQDMVASVEMDPFANGTMSPVRLIEGSETMQAVVDNPNVLTEEDMRLLLRAHHKTFEKKINEISSPYVYRRMIELADDVEGLTVERLGKLKARLAEVTTGDVPVRETEQAAP